VRYSQYFLLIVLILLVACGGEEPEARPTTAVSEENTPTESPTEPTATTVEEAPTETAVVEEEPAATTVVETETAETPTEVPATEAAPDSGKRLPPSTLFDIEWHDRSPFQAGLVEAEAHVLDELLSGTVYHMDLALSEDGASLSGRQEILYTNQEAVVLDAVYYHLYPNILGGRVDVSAVTVNEVPVSAELQNQDSILRVPVESTLPPGGQVVIQLEFLVDIPTESGSNYGVFATIDGVVALAHFYPQVAVYDAEGWDTAVPPSNGDVTYSDSNYYLVRLTAPADLVLMTSGIITENQAEGDNQVLTIASGPTRDFYLAGSDEYIVSTATIGETTVKSYGFPEFAERVDAALEYTLASMESFNNRFGVYPFTEFEIGPTPNLALGVEYPGVVVLNARIYDPDDSFGSTPTGFYIEATTVHEVAHQWYYSVVGNDQPNEPWVDEALVSYATYLYFVDEYGESGAEGYRQSFFNRWDVLDREEIPIGMPAGSYEGSAYSAIVYGRGPLFFEALSETMGEAVFNEFIRDYYETFQWGIATGRDIKTLAEEHCGCDLTPLFETWVGEL
jgi:hypothetical protein